MSRSEEWQALKAEQRAERTAFFDDGRQEFRILRNTIFREVREEFRDEWAAYYAARREGMDNEALLEMKAGLVGRQDAVLNERRNAACAEMREARDGVYADLLEAQREERAELTARQAVGENALAEMRFDAANRNEREAPPGLESDGAVWAFREAATEVTRPAAVATEPNVERSEASGHGGPLAEPNPGVRDGADIVAGLGLGMLGGAATLAERLLDGFFGGSPAPSAPANDHAPRTEPAPNPFKAVAAEARQAAEREQEEAARDAWWDERRARARD